MDTFEDLKEVIAFQEVDGPTLMILQNQLRALLTYGARKATPPEVIRQNAMASALLIHGKHAMKEAAVNFSSLKREVKI